MHPQPLLQKNNWQEKSKKKVGQKSYSCEVAMLVMQKTPEYRTGQNCYTSCIITVIATRHLFFSGPPIIGPNNQLCIKIFRKNRWLFNYTLMSSAVDRWLETDTQDKNFCWHPARMSGWIGRENSATGNKVKLTEKEVVFFIFCTSLVHKCNSFLKLSIGKIVQVL